MPVHSGASNLIGSGRLEEPHCSRDDPGTSRTERAPMHLPVSMPVSEARAALLAAGEVIALVTNRGVDVGVVTAEDLADTGSTPTRVIGDVMGCEVVRIDPSTDLRWTLRTYREAAWTSAIRRRPGELPDRSTP